MNRQTPPEEERLNANRELTAATIRQVLKENSALLKNEDGTILSFEEREDLIERVSAIMPAGNAVSFVFNGILTARDRSYASPNTGRSHINALFKSLSLMKDNLFHRMAFAGPASVLAGYNMLLQLAGADPEDFLPHGVWQFYVEFGLRENAAHHQNETRGFQDAVRNRFNHMSDAEQLTAWILAIMWLLHEYETWLEVIWGENVHLHVIEQETGLRNSHRQWEKERIFHPPQSGERLLPHRQQQFQSFSAGLLRSLDQAAMARYKQAWLKPEQKETFGRQMRAYKRQMSIFQHLDPGEYSEERYPTRLEDRCIAIVHRNRYFLLDLIDPTNPHAAQQIFEQVLAILSGEGPKAEVDQMLASVERGNQARLRGTLSKEQRADLERLRKASVILNWDMTDGANTLPSIRNTHRGVGDHALTIVRTDRSMVFDFSHIFFDGPWAMAVAEILTDDTTNQLRKLHRTRLKIPAKVHPAQALNLTTTQSFIKMRSRYPSRVDHICAEESAQIAPLQDLRQIIADRTRPALRITINDLLVLYRTIFNQYYQPDQSLQDQLYQLSQMRQGANLAQDVQTMLATLANTNPSLLIPIDASRFDPKERIFPLAYRSPLPNFATEHQQLLDLKRETSKGWLFGMGRRQGTVEAFEQNRQKYLGYLSSFCEVMARYREMAIEGQTMSATAIRMIAGLPAAAQQFADGIPDYLPVVNEAIKGEEVFSNMGQVVPGSSLTRFASAKDDNDKKVLVWGIMTDQRGQLILTLRDFRPPVTKLSRQGHDDLAHQITQDFLSAYMSGLLDFVTEMREIISMSTRNT